MKIKTLKPKSLIKGVDFTSGYYIRLSDAIMAVADPAELLRIKEDEPERFKYILQTFLILAQTLDEKASEQGLVEEVEIDEKNQPPEESQ